jgi:hypothetical protein
LEKDRRNRLGRLSLYQNFKIVGFVSFWVDQNSFLQLNI